LKFSDLLDVDAIRRALKGIPSVSAGLHKAASGSSLLRYRQFLDEWDKGFMDAEEQPVGYWADVVYGEIPEDLEGTFFRNGPGRFSIGTTPIDHPYDGDGLVASLAFKKGKAYFRSRFVSTPE
jgi:all-trans-8'-apo-beta-carotenal 15,15'-oxygenase